MLLSGIAKGRLEDEVAFELREKVRRTIFEAEPRMRTLIAYHQEYCESQAGRWVVHHHLEGALTHVLELSSRFDAYRKDDWDSGSRVESIMSRLTDFERFPPHMLDITSGFERASVEAVSKVHSAEYVHFVHELSKEATQQGGSPIPFHPFVPKPNSGSPLPAVDSEAMTVGHRKRHEGMIDGTSFIVCDMSLCFTDVYGSWYLECGKEKCGGCDHSSGSCHVWAQSERFLCGAPSGPPYRGQWDEEYFNKWVWPQPVQQYSDWCPTCIG